MLQALLKSKAIIRTAGALMAAYIGFIKRTSSVKEDPVDFINKNLPDHPLIIAMWHGQGLLLPYLRTRDDTKVTIMVAKHIDGDIVDATIRRFGMTTIRGSGSGRTGKDKGGFAALRACIGALRNDTTVALTADIPPGPARKAGLGLVTLAKLSGRSILPCAVVTNRYFKLNTWSGFTVNLPFSNMVIAGGEQIRVPRHATVAELEAARQALEDGLNEVTARAYKSSGTTERGGPTGKKANEYGTILRGYTLTTRLLQPTAPLLLKYR
ncbi:MAG: lysophospholipid acyltransferase family protein, partial [Methyloligellaceae bacterium]